MAAVGACGFGAGHNENISGTSDWFKLCGYIVSDGEGPARFCDAPAEDGNSYCAPHRALCQVAPGSPEGLKILRELEREAAAAPPPNVGPLLVTEMLEPTAPEEAAESLDLPRAPSSEDAP